MSKLEKLIAELCPGGVPIVELSTIAEYAKDRIDASEIDADTYVGVDNLLPDKKGKTVSSYVPSEGRLIHFHTGDILIGNIRPYLKKIWLADTAGGTNGDVLPVHIKVNNVEPRFLYYCLSSDQFFLYDMQHAKGAKMPRGDKAAVMEYKVPVPPVEIQHEIVRMLDNFTQLTAELIEKLTVELTARQKQYEYYRDLLLTFAETGNTLATDRQTDRQAEIRRLQSIYGYTFVRLEEVILSLNTGLNPRQFFKLNTEDAENFYVTIREIVGGRIVTSEKTDRMNDEALRLCNNRSNLEAGDVLFSGTGTIGETAVIEETPTNWNIKEGVYTIKPNQEFLNPKFLRYLLMTQKIRNLYMKKVAGGTVKSIPMKEMRMLAIPLPPVKRQMELVSIVERFDNLCNDLSSGLPAEIEARQKQYEYYRDKLLTFKEKA